MKSDCQMHEHYIRLLCHAGRLQWAIAKPETCPCATACAATNGSAGLKFFLSVGMGVWGYGGMGRREGGQATAGGRAGDHSCSASSAYATPQTPDSFEAESLAIS